MVQAPLMAAVALTRYRRSFQEGAARHPEPCRLSLILAEPEERALNGIRQAFNMQLQLSGGRILLLPVRFVFRFHAVIRLHWSVATSRTDGFDSISLYHLSLRALTIFLMVFACLHRSVGLCSLIFYRCLRSTIPLSLSHISGSGLFPDLMVTHTCSFVLSPLFLFHSIGNIYASCAHHESCCFLFLGLSSYFYILKWLLLPRGERGVVPPPLLLPNHGSFLFPLTTLNSTWSVDDTHPDPGWFPSCRLGFYPFSYPPDHPFSSPRTRVDDQCPCRYLPRALLRSDGFAARASLILLSHAFTRSVLSLLITLGHSLLLATGSWDGLCILCMVDTGW